MKVILVIAIAALSLPLCLMAQTAKVLKQPGLKKLSVFVGTWKSQTIIKGIAQPIGAKYTCRWSINGNYLIADQIIFHAKTTTNNLSIYSYDAENDNYKLSLVGVPGMAPFTIGITYKGDEFVYSSDYMDNGKKVYSRTLNDFITPSYYTFKVQSSTDSINWITSLEGKSVKIAK
jgi:hypothetical protein